jgi:putative ABC transport system permease protein
LRALGTSRSQTRSAVRWEAVLISVFGALLGLAIGVAFGMAAVHALHDRGLTELTLPTGQLAALVAAGGLAGLIAAALPTRRAARLDILQAVASV